MSLHQFVPLFLPSPSVSIYPHHLITKLVHLTPFRCSHLKVISFFIFVFSIHHCYFSLGSFHQSKCANIFHHSFFLQPSCCSSVLFIPSGVVIFLLPLIFLFVESHSFHPFIIHLYSLLQGLTVCHRSSSLSVLLFPQIYSSFFTYHTLAHI